MLVQICDGVYLNPWLVVAVVATPRPPDGRQGCHVHLAADSGGVSLWCDAQPADLVRAVLAARSADPDESSGARPVRLASKSSPYEEVSV